MLKQMNGIVGVLDSEENSDYSFEHELLSQIVSLFCALTSFLPDKESNSQDGFPMVDDHVEEWCSLISSSQTIVMALTC